MICTKTGLDNHGKPVKDFLDKLKGLDDKALGLECEKYIWLSAYANNNPRSDYHWMCDACYDECESRGKGTIYKLAWERVAKDN